MLHLFWGAPVIPMGLRTERTVKAHLSKRIWFTASIPLNTLPRLSTRAITSTKTEEHRNYYSSFLYIERKIGVFFPHNSLCESLIPPPFFKKGTAPGLLVKWEQDELLTASRGRTSWDTAVPPPGGSTWLNQKLVRPKLERFTKSKPQTLSRAVSNHLSRRNVNGKETCVIWVQNSLAIGSWVVLGALMSFGRWGRTTLKLTSVTWRGWHLNVNRLRHLDNPSLSHWKYHRASKRDVIQINTIDTILRVPIFMGHLPKQS